MKRLSNRSARKRLQFAQEEIAIGEHLILELNNCRRVSVLDDLETLRKVAVAAAASANVQLLDIFLHRFQPQGATLFAVLAESHLAIHTWPELNYVAADIFTCGNRAIPALAAKSLIAAFEPSSSVTTVLVRRTLRHRLLEQP